MNRSRRVLIISSASGGGHNTQARAFAEWAERLYGGAVEVRVETVFEDSSPILRACVDFYNFIQRRAPWFHHAFYQWTECLGVANADSVSVGRDYFLRMLRDWKPDVLLSVHDCLNKGYFEEAKATLGNDLRCVTYCVEFAGGYGFSRGWVNPTADLFAGRTSETVEAATGFGFPAAKARAVGSLLAPGFYDAAPEPTSWLAEHTGFNPEIPTLLLATGGAGAENHVAILRRLRHLDIQVVALCGRNRPTAARLENWLKKNPGFPLHIQPFTDEMPLWLRACSVLFARPGSIAAEALHCGCPVVFNTIGSAMPHELPTLRWFSKRGIARRASSPRALARILESLLQNPEKLASWKSSFRACSIPGHPSQFVRHVLENESTPI